MAGGGIIVSPGCGVFLRPEPKPGVFDLSGRWSKQDPCPELKFECRTIPFGLPGVQILTGARLRRWKTETFQGQAMVFLQQGGPLKGGCQIFD
jgi:hypothetical protein